MDYNQLLRDVRAARRMLNKAISRLENNSGENVSFMAPVQPSDLDTLTKFIELRLGVFQSDMASATQMCNTLRNPIHKEHLLCPADVFTPVRVGRLFRQIPNSMHAVSSLNRKNTRLCIYRDVVRYRTMSAKMLHESYAEQIAHVTI